MQRQPRQFGQASRECRLSSAGVSEYWIVDSLSRLVDAYSLRRKKYMPIQERDGKISSAVLRGFYLRPEWLKGEKRGGGARKDTSMRQFRPGPSEYLNRWDLLTLD